MSRLIRTIDGILSGIEWLGQLARQLRGLPPIANQPEQVKGMSDSTREHIRKQIDSAAREFPVTPTETWACSHCGEGMPTWVGKCTMCMRGLRPPAVKPGALPWTCAMCHEPNVWQANQCRLCGENRPEGV